ncbi:MAG: chromate efflux transporter [Parvularculaceae bacterium]
MADINLSYKTSSTDHSPTLREALPVWLKIGCLSFGGPAGQIALMHKMLVDERQWIDERRFLDGLNFCMLLPGPEAQQLATYVGWRLNGILGGVVSGVLFVAPGALVILGLSILYFGYRDQTVVEGVFFGVRAAVIAIVIEALLKISKRALKSPMAYLVAAAAFIAIFVFHAPFPLIVATAALAGFAAMRTGRNWFAVKEADTGPRADERVSVRRGLTAAVVCTALWAAPVIGLVAALGPDHVFAREAVFFSKMAVVTFGGAYAVLAYVAQEAVNTYGWLQPGEMVDGLGLAETTPGPLVLVLQFVGFLAAAKAETGLPPLVAGAIGGLIVLWTTFVPCFLWIFLGGPFIERLRRARALSSALAAVTAAVVGVVLNLSVWFAAHVIFARVGVFERGPVRVIVPEPASIDFIAFAIAVAAAIALFRFRVGLIPLLAGSGLAGVAAMLAM